MALMRNINLTLSYDGTDFIGWQTQPGFRTVQETLETAIAALTGEPAFASTPAAGPIPASTPSVRSSTSTATAIRRTSLSAPSTLICRPTSSCATPPTCRGV